MERGDRAVASASSHRALGADAAGTVIELAAAVGQASPDPAAQALGGRNRGCGWVPAPRQAAGSGQPDVVKRACRQGAGGTTALS
jgi:hypothetical protein